MAVAEAPMRANAFGSARAIISYPDNPAMTRLSTNKKQWVFEEAAQGTEGIVEA
jgi:hypothetical protein